MHENRTSALCSKCAYGFSEDIDVTKEYMQGPLGPKPVDGGRRQRIYGVRMCPHCRTTWNRDVNAAINMVTLLLEGQKRGGQRAPAFKRTPTAAATVAVQMEAEVPIRPTGAKRQRLEEQSPASTAVQVESEAAGTAEAPISSTGVKRQRLPSKGLLSKHTKKRSPRGGEAKSGHCQGEMT